MKYKQQTVHMEKREEKTRDPCIYANERRLKISNRGETPENCRECVECEEDFHRIVSVWHHELETRLIRFDGVIDISDTSPDH